MLPISTYFIKTFGCQMNESDSERIASFLEANNFKESKADSSAKALAKADLVVFNTCGVRQTAEDRVYGQVHNLRKKNKEVVIVITGCLARRQDVQRKLKDKVDLFIGIEDLFNLPLCKGGLRGFLIEDKCKNIPNSPSKKEGTNSYLKIKPKYKSTLEANVPIMTGCNNFCSYCVVPYARGREYSRPMDEIINEIETLSKKGCKEIILLGQNVNSYEYRIKNQASQRLVTLWMKSRNKEKLKIKKLFTKFKNYKIKNSYQITFPFLINYLAETYPQIKFSFLTSHPKDFSNELIEVIKKNKNISREIHLPVQSGSNRILKLMNRPYTQKHYLDLIEKIKKEIPDARISTDVIVGFPGETEKDFQETAKVFKKVGFFMAYVNKYSPRPGTAAFELKDNVSWDEKKKREKRLRKLLKK